MAGATEALALWVARLGPADPPPAVRAAAGRLLLDWTGNAIGGARGPSSGAMARFADATAPGGIATAVGRPEGLHPAWAALVNGQSAHVLECDDTDQASSSHPGAAVWAAVLAAAEERDATLGEAITAAIAGYEVVGRLGEALGPAEHYARGFHPTGTCGALGCAAAVARLAGLDPTATRDALGIASSQAAGSMEFLADGAWTKRLHPGWAAHAGLVAAGLAAAGFTGPSTAIEGRNGFLASHSAAPRPALVDAGLGESWVVARTSIKAHACCRYEQAPIDGLLQLVAEHRFGPPDVERIRIGMLAAGWDIVAEPRARKIAPGSVVDAQFSMPFGAAVALVRGRASVHEHSGELLRDPAILRAMALVECVRDPALDAHYPRRWPAWTEVELRDGRVLRAAVDHPRGDPENPLSDTDLAAKFRDLAGEALPAARLDRLLAALADPDPAMPARELGGMMRPRP